MPKHDRSADGSGWRPVPGTLRTAAVAGGCLLVLAATIALLAWVLIHLAPLTLAVIAALLLAALLNPVAALLRRLRLPGWLAALSAVLLLLAIVVGPLALLANQAIAQFADVEQQVLQGIDETRRLLVDGPLPLNDSQLDSAIAELATALQGAAPDPVSGATTALQTLASLGIALVLLFFLLRDGARMWQWLVGLVPAGRREQIDDAARDGWATMVAYVRGTVIVAAVDAVGIGIDLLIVDVPLALALAFLTFLFAFIPIVGAVVAGAAAVLVALVSNGLTDALLVLAAVLFVQQVESNLLQPFIMGKALRLHPAVVLLAVSTGTLVGGIAGAVVAVPLTAVTYRVADRAYNYHPSRPQPETSTADGGDADGDHQPADHPSPIPPDTAPAIGGRRPRWLRRYAAG
jgi:predicted PurR-regulated permease PerM